MAPASSPALRMKSWRSIPSVIGVLSQRRVGLGGAEISFRRPGVSFALKSGAPGIQGVIEDNPMAQHLVVVFEDVGEPKGDGVEAGRLRGEVETRGVRPPYNLGEVLQGWIVQRVLGEEGIEAAQLTDMAEFDAGDVIRDGAGLGGD